MHAVSRNIAGTPDVRGYVNPFVPGETETGQKQGMAPSIEIYVENKWGKIIDGLIRSVRDGTIVEVKELHCLAPGHFRAQKRKRLLIERIEAIKERGGIIREWSTGYMSKGRMARMTGHAFDQIAFSGRARKRRAEGRPPIWPSEGPEAESYRAIWNSRLFHNDDERVAAIKKQFGKSPSRQWLRNKFGVTPSKATMAQSRRARALVYFIRDRKRVKIGHSINPDMRMKVFFTHSTLTLMATEPGGQKREAELHKHFARLRVNGTREWFHLKPELEEYVKSLETNDKD